VGESAGSDFCAVAGIGGNGGPLTPQADKKILSNKINGKKLIIFDAKN
jgi:hypothetical protein